jgi:NAD(P)-dependent dehydrogenase (short-subunit alcohol dehydrogenase family)
MDPDGKIAVVTGAAGGIGNALVQGLLARGARTVVAADLAGTGAEYVLDVADEQATQALIEELERNIGPIELWFANAGVATASGPEAPDQDWERQWRVNVMSHVYAARALLPRWIERGGGHLITTASMAGILSAVGDAAYSATKHAALGLAEWLAFTYRDRGVRVSCVCPGAVDTAMLRAGAGGDAAKASAIIGGGEVIAPDVAAERILDGVAHDQFLILTHPAMQEFAVVKAQDPERWIRGMTRLYSAAQALLSPPGPEAAPRA